MICPSLNLIVLISIIHRVDGLLGKITGRVYKGRSLALDFSVALKASQLYSSTWMYLKARPIYNLVQGKTIRGIELRWFSKSFED